MKYGGEKTENKRWKDQHASDERERERQRERERERERKVNG